MKMFPTEKHLMHLNNQAKKELCFKKDLYFKNHGTNDARFASKLKIPSVAFGPIGDNYHAQNDYVLIESLEIYYNIIKNFVKNL